MNSFPLYDRMIQDMQLHGYSDRTQVSYARCVRQLYQYTQCPPAEITEDQLREYFLYRMNESKWARATMMIAYSGIKFFFLNTLKRDWHTLDLVRPQRERKLPVVLSIDEVRQILAAFTTPQHRAYYTTVYSCGLRLLEGLNLQVSDIDGDRMMLHVHRGKGAKDRYVPLPKGTLELLRNYWKTHRNKVLIFPSLGRGRTGGSAATKPMSVDAVQGALGKVAAQLPKIKKHFRTHTFRHSYATHLLEAGVSIRMVQRFLGHASLSSTMVYVHVTRTGHEDACRKVNALMRKVQS
jgi:integrase/recombinase XerD